MFLAGWIINASCFVKILYLIFQVSLLLSRDLDSLPSDRETAAVEEFLEDPDSFFHIMRDHPQHGAKMLAGMWDEKLDAGNGYGRRKWRQTWRNAAESGLLYVPRSSGYSDQIFLERYVKLMRGCENNDPKFAKISRYVWPWIEKVSMAHDAYSCTDFPNTRPFPTQRKQDINNHVGSVTSEANILQTECPAQCRPKGHLDWIYC